jgi:cell division protein FtsZ
MVFITAGMGGGTGTGAGPVIARAAREAGILTVGVITKPFQFEGSQRMRTAEAGIQELQKYVDTLIIIPNQNLFRVANEKTTFADAFKMADDVLYSGVRGVTDLMVMPGLINLDFADIRAVMGEMGKAMMGTGEAEGDRRSIDAAEAAISNPLLDDVSMKGAKGVLINVTGGPDMTLFEVDEAANRIREEVDPEANIIFGSTFDDALEGRMRISVVATGIDAAAMAQPRPVISLVSDRSRAEAAGLMPTGMVSAAAISMAPMTASMPMATASGPVTAGTSALAIAQPQLMAEPQPQLQAQPAPQPQPAPMVTSRSGVAPLPPAFATPAPQPAAAPAPQTAIERPVVRANAFIPPKPIEPQVRPTPQAAPPVVTPNPYAEAAMANGGRATAPKKARMPSLFERVTGVGRARQAPAEPPAPAVVPAAPAPSAAPQQQQPRLGALDPSDRAMAAKGEEDLLEIPAFLRRQAN